ncbi:hypothetical protein BWQ93_07770 [Sphingopyxis sp. QXT-31]|uniref:hypothetical protein n=1 Tax=Sphingopyxis sp. QXT-31 TaxID=1357916 RepID=UPI00097959A4|nr:hypothetical protein [Sphingopyxis sp. QXT-31]APZ98397.1 hypothetical protein BWQ93_07770 [Sphingopyxis sp. QXT-31]
MAETPLFSQLASVNPALSARLKESAAFLAAPAATRLSEEQRALVLGIARRLVESVARLLGGAVDSRALWDDWAAQGLPGAAQLSSLCFARAEEHRWRNQPVQDVGEAPPPRVISSDAAIDVPVAAEDPPSAIDRAYLALQIADRRRFDALGHPRIAIDDMDLDLLRALLLDIAAWALVQAGKDSAEAARLGEAVRGALAQHRPERGIDRAAADYHAALSDAGTLADSAAAAIARHDWASFIALAAATHKYRYDAMALALITAEPAQLAPMLAPLLRDQAALVSLEGSLVMLPGRAVASAAPDDYTAALQARAARFGETEGAA